MVTHRVRIEALLTHALGKNEWELFTSDNGEAHWKDPVAVRVHFTVPFKYEGYGLCDAAAGTPTTQAVFLMEQVLEGICKHPDDREALAEYVIMLAAQEVADRN